MCADRLMSSYDELVQLPMSAAFNSTGLFNPGKVLPEPGAAPMRVAIPVGVAAAVGPETWV